MMFMLWQMENIVHKSCCNHFERIRWWVYYCKWWKKNCFMDRNMRHVLEKIFLWCQGVREFVKNQIFPNRFSASKKWFSSFRNIFKIAYFEICSKAHECDPKSTIFSAFENLFWKKKIYQFLIEKKKCCF